MSVEEAPEAQPEVDIRGANTARALYLAQHGDPPPLDIMYLRSLLEFILGDQLEAADEFHQRRIAPILDRAVQNAVKREELQAAQKTRQEILRK